MSVDMTSEHSSEAVQEKEHDCAAKQRSNDARTIIGGNEIVQNIPKKQTAALHVH